MNIVVLSKSDKPIYEQLYEQITAEILNGGLPANFCLPSIRQISKELEISIITVKKAYDMLESDGLIYTRAGKGCFVAEHAKGQLTDKKTDLAVSQLKKDIQYYKNLNISLDELLELVKELF